MIETALHNLLLDVPRAAAIWLALLTLAVVALAALVTRTGRWRPEDVARIREAVRRRGRMAAQARDLERYAHEVAIAADGAVATAARGRARWLAAQDEVESTWQALDLAESAARRLAATAGFGVPRTPRTPAEYADRERFLHHAAIAACFRRELPVLELSEVLAHRNGWDPRRHPVEQEIILSRVVRDRSLAAYNLAVSREQEAWHASDVAAVSAQTLREEAVVAAERATQARCWLPPAAPVAPATDTTATVPVRVRPIRLPLPVGVRSLAGSSR